MKKKGIHTFSILSNALILCCVCITLASCASTPKTSPARLIESTDRMMWELHGSNGSTVYVLGTFHLADESIGSLSESLLAAFDSADRIVGEISSEDWAQYQKVLTLNLVDSISYVGNNFNDIQLHLTKDEAAILTELLTPDIMNVLKIYQPWVITSVLTQAVYEALNFNAAYGVDVQLIARANEEGRVMEGLDAIQTQMDVMRFGTYEQQLKILKDTILLITLEDSADLELLLEMYDAYKNNDRNALATVLMLDEEKQYEEDSDFAQAYHTVLYDNRNIAWADLFHSYLEQGGTTFVFAGAGHFVGNNNVFDIMEEKGYITRN